MGTFRDQIEHLEHRLQQESDKPWKNFSRSRKMLKRMMNRYIRRQKIEPDDVGGKRGRKPTKGWEY